MIKAHEYTAFIFARGGSKGIPKKNIREINNCPLIGYAIESALKSKHINRVIVSTDCQEIASISRAYGAQTPFDRPSELAHDTSPELLAWRHALEQEKDYFSKIKNAPFISLPATSPLRSSLDIDSAIEKYLQNRNEVDMILAISESRRNPYLNMVTVCDTGLISVAIPDAKHFRRQDVPKVFDISTSVYVAHPEYIKSCSRIIDGRVGYVVVPPERSIDIDDEFDLYIAELLIKNPFIRGKLNNVTES